LSASVNDFSKVNSNIHIRNSISVAHIAKRTSVGNITTNSHKPSQYRSVHFVKIRIIGDVKCI